MNIYLVESLATWGVCVLAHPLLAGGPGAMDRSQSEVFKECQPCLDDTVVDFRAGRRASLMVHPSVHGDSRGCGHGLIYSSKQSCAAHLGAIVFTEEGKKALESLRGALKCSLTAQESVKLKQQQQQHYSRNRPEKDFLLKQTLIRLL